MGRGLPDLLIVLKNIKTECPESYNFGSIIIKNLGNEILDPKFQKVWNNSF
jgi:hypothetical protein